VLNYDEKMMRKCMKMYDGFRQSTKKDNVLVPKHRWSLNENNKENLDIVPGFPVNKKMKYDRAKMVKAIQNGMIILISYAGDKDKWKGGRERSIYPMVLGFNKNTKNELIRGWHLEGYSVSQKSETKKVWRLFKASNIKTMTFTGHFYRLPPKGYKMNDRVMTERTIARADFNTIRRNQETLVKSGKIEKEEEVKMATKTSLGTSKIQIKNTETQLDMKNPWFHELLKKSKKYPEDVKISILKTILSNDYIAVLGALGEVGKTVKVYEGKKLIGSYKTIDSFTGKDFKNKKNIKGISDFDLYIFEKRL